MNMNNLTIAEAITKVQEGFGSVYTKEDVITLLNAITSNQDKEEDDLEVLAELIEEGINREITNDWVDLDTAEFEIDYNNRVVLNSVDLSESNVNSDVSNAIKTAILGYRALLEENRVQQASKKESATEGTLSQIEE